MPTVEYPTNPNTDTAFVTDDGGKRTRSLKTVLVDGTIDYPKNANVKDCYVTIDGKKQRALMTADVSKDGVVEYPDGSNSTKGYVTVDGKKHRVVLTAVLAGGAPDPVIAELNVTPTTSAQTITAPEGTDGYNPVNVSAVTSSIDANIQAGNIKKDVTILGVTGSYEAPTPTGTINITTNGMHNVTDYATADVNVPVGGTMYGATAESFLGTIDANGIIQGATTPTDLVFTGVKGFSSVTATMGTFFRRFQNLNSIRTVSFPDLEEISTDYAMDNCFYYCGGIISISFPKLKHIFNQYALNACFVNNISLTSASFPSLTRIARSSMNTAFQGCTNLETADLSLVVQGGDNAISGLQSLCDGCTKLKTVHLDSLNWLYSSGLQYAFRNCTSLEDVYLSSLAGASASGIKNSLVGTTGVKVHFPSNMQTKIASLTDYPNFGGTNTVLLFDMPEVVQYIDITKTGTSDIYRSYVCGARHTNNAFAWICIQRNDDIMYTSGLTLPSVNDVVYSDPECTIPFGTVTGIVPL